MKELYQTSYDYYLGKAQAAQNELNEALEQCGDITQHVDLIEKLNEYTRIAAEYRRWYDEDDEGTG